MYVRGVFFANCFFAFSQKTIQNSADASCMQEVQIHGLQRALSAGVPWMRRQFKVVSFLFKFVMIL